ncbi:MAG: hypothetical protein ABFC42_14145 [Sulfuricella sp.]
MNRSSYAFDCLAASGLAVMSPAIAYELRPDLWACVADCARTLNTQAKVPGTQRMTATFDGLDPVLVLARSLDNLEQRLQWIVGRSVLGLKPADQEAQPADRVDFNRLSVNAKEAERLEQVRKLSLLEPPSHDCQHRRDILAARRELGLPVAA